LPTPGRGKASIVMSHKRSVIVSCVETFALPISGVLAGVVPDIVGLIIAYLRSDERRVGTEWFD
ncbi:hypothetical protein MMA93_23265, partial [Salmonella enterica]|nr:hypothetical protein [Salmonella enterica]